MNLVENRHGQYLADTGQRTEAMEGVAVVLLDGTNQVQLDVANEAVVMFGQFEVAWIDLRTLGSRKLSAIPSRLDL